MDDIKKKSVFDQDAFNYLVAASLGNVIKIVDHNAKESNRLERNITRLSGRMFWLNISVASIAYAGYKTYKEVTKLQKEVEELKRMKGE